MLRAWVGRNGERLAVWTLALLVVVAAVGVALVQPYPVDERRVAAAADPAVSVERTDAGVVVRPAEGATGAVAFYPGALVPAAAYVPLAGRLAAETGLVVYLLDAPLNLAVLDIDAADAVVGSDPAIEKWYVGGHSLGGAMACRYADERHSVPQAAGRSPATTRTPTDSRASSSSGRTATWTSATPTSRS